MFLILIGIVLDFEGLINVPVVKDSKDVLAGSIEGPSEKEVGKAEIVVLPGQDVVIVLETSKL